MWFPSGMVKGSMKVWHWMIPQYPLQKPSLLMERTSTSDKTNGRESARKAWTQPDSLTLKKPIWRKLRGRSWRNSSNKRSSSRSIKFITGIGQSTTTEECTWPNTMSYRFCKGRLCLQIRPKVSMISLESKSNRIRANKSLIYQSWVSSWLIKKLAESPESKIKVLMKSGLRDPWVRLKE